MDDLTPYGQERWLAGSKWKPGLKPSDDQSEESKVFNCLGSEKGPCDGFVKERRPGCYSCDKCIANYSPEVIEILKRKKKKLRKPFLTAADLVMLREMRIKL